MFDKITLSCRVTRAEDEAREFDEQVTVLKGENEGLKKLVRDLEIMKQSKIDLIKRLESELNDLGEENDRLRYRLDDALEEIRELEDKLSGAE
jgi:chromosome segregation ATPase